MKILPRVPPYLLLLYLLSGSALAQDSKLSIDLFQATINGKALFDARVDDVTTMLGRPTAIDDGAALNGIMGPQLFYHSLGLSFWFDGKRNDPLERLFSLRLYLSRQWDKRFGKFFEPFSGILSKNLSAD